MEVMEYNGTSLAYIGDALMSLYVREMLLSKGYQKPDVLQKKSVAWVSANAQALFLTTLKEQNFFTEDEWSIVLRGRNTNISSKAKNASVQAYRLSTGLEAVFGYLYLTHQEARLKELWEAIKEIGEYHK